MTWQQELKTSIRSTQDLLAHLKLSPDDFADSISTSPSFPVMVTPHYLSLIDSKSPNDPLLRQVLAIDAESIDLPGFEREPLREEQFMPIPGLIHKYPGRVLLMTTAGCAIHCRYCFRKHIDYSERMIDKNTWPDIENYLKVHCIDEVIFSGGDPLLLANSKLSSICQKLMNIGIKRIRIHSRMPSILPSRIDDGFLKIASKLKEKMIIVNHINHPNELSIPLQEKSLRLKQCGVHLYNQSVFLKGVNDSFEILATLSEKLIEHHIQPYYIHQLDPVSGTQHFALSTKKCTEIMTQLRHNIPGYMVPLWVVEEPGQPSKSPVI